MRSFQTDYSDQSSGLLAGGFFRFCHFFQCGNQWLPHFQARLVDIPGEKCYAVAIKFKEVSTMNLGETIYHLRMQRGMSQGDLAEALDVSRQSVSKWENNSATPELEKLIRMSELFGVTLDQLVGRKESPSPAPEEPPPVPVQHGMPAHRVLGIILLSFGLLTAILGLLASLLLTFLGIPLITVGIVCLVSTGNLPYKCGWALFAVCAPVGSFFILNLIGYGAMYSIVFFVLWLVAMLLWTGIGIRRGTLGSGSRKLAIVCIATALVLTILTALAGSALFHRDISHSESLDLEEYAVEMD